MAAFFFLRSGSGTFPATPRIAAKTNMASIFMTVHAAIVEAGKRPFAAVDDARPVARRRMISCGGCTFGRVIDLRCFSSASMMKALPLISGRTGLVEQPMVGPVNLEDRP
ncbi:hypothetical protein [Aquamicrobium terrae]